MATANPNPNLRGPAQQFSSKYSVSNYSYPIDIMEDTYGGNFVTFYINVSEDSKLLNDKNVKVVADAILGDRGDLLNAATSGEIGATTAVGVAGASTVVSALWSGDKPPGGWFKQAAGGVAVAAAASTGSRAMKRLATAITLYVPNQLSIRYGTQWSEEETFNYQATMAGAQALGKALTSNPFGSQGVIQQAEQGLSIGAAIALRGDNKNNAALSAATGLAANPKKEQVFKGVDFRTFQMDYMFFPRNEAEARNVLNIIYEFKYHMHPEFKDSSNFLYIYPSEFDIEYYQGGKENLNIHRHTSCVLTEMNVNYTPNGQFNTFANGMPTQISVSLSFRELAQLTKDKIRDKL